MKQWNVVIVGLIAAVCSASVVVAAESEESSAALAPVADQLPVTGFADPVIDLGPPATDPILKWTGPDSLVTNPSEEEVTPSIASAPSGELFAAVDQRNSGRILIYHSTDGGETWSWLASFVHGSNSRNPALTYAENSGERWLVLVYEYWISDTSRSLRSWRVDADNPQGNNAFADIDASIPWIGADKELHPQITSDFPDFTSAVYFYVTYAVPSLDYYPVFFSRSTDRALTWSTPENITGGSENTAFESRPDIAYSAHRNDVYVAFNKPGWTGSEWAPQVWVTNNTSSGVSGSWLAPVQVTTSSIDDSYPSVAAAWDSDTVMVAWTRSFTGDNDVLVSYSTDGGAVWSSAATMPGWTYEDEDSVDLAASQAASGRFHAAYRHNDPAITSGGDIWYSWAAVSNPSSWSSALDIDEGSNTSGLSYYPRPSICVDLSQAPEDEASIAWTTWTPGYRVFFDSAMLGNFDLIFADDFESGNTSFWSSTTP